MRTQLQNPGACFGIGRTPPGFAGFTDEIGDGENAVTQPVAGRANAGNVSYCPRFKYLLCQPSLSTVQN